MFRFSRALAALSACFILVFTSLGVGFAQTSQTGGSGVQITPTRTEMSLLPGEQKDFSIAVKNVTKGPITVKSFFNDFEADNVTGEPQIITDPNRQVANSMKSYIKGLGDFPLAAGETKEVKLSVDIPSSASPGGYYGVVRFAAVPQGTEGEQAGTQVSLTASVASLLLVEVSGNITEQIQVDSIKACTVVFKDENQGKQEGDKLNTSAAPNCPKSSSIFLQKAPNDVSIAITNKGNSFSKPFGRVTVTRGGTEVYAYELNNTEPRGIILPNSSRVFSNKIENVNKFGRYTVTASVSYGQGGEVIVQKMSFWYIPTWMLLVLIALLVGLVVLIVVIYRKLGSKRKKHSKK